MSDIEVLGSYERKVRDEMIERCSPNEEEETSETVIFDEEGDE